MREIEKGFQIESPNVSYLGIYQTNRNEGLRL